MENGNSARVNRKNRKKGGKGKISNGIRSFFAISGRNRASHLTFHPEFSKIFEQMENVSILAFLLIGLVVSLKINQLI